MASTVLLFDLDAFSDPATVYLFTTVPGQVSPDSLGYTLTDTGQGWSFEATAIEALVGVYRVVVKDSTGVIVGQGYIMIVADDVGPYTAATSYSEAVMLSRVTDSRVGYLDEIPKIPRADGGLFTHTNNNKGYSETVTITKP